MDGEEGQMRQKCDRCGSHALSDTGTGLSCIICGNFIFAEYTNTDDAWVQYRINGQFVSFNEGWPNKEYPVVKSWAIVEEVRPVRRGRFREYAGV